MCEGINKPLQNRASLRGGSGVRKNASFTGVKSASRKPTGGVFPLSAATGVKRRISLDCG